MVGGWPWTESGENTTTLNYKDSLYIEGRMYIEGGLPVDPALRIPSIIFYKEGPYKSYK